MGNYPIQQTVTDDLNSNSKPRIHSLNSTLPTGHLDKSLKTGTPYFSLGFCRILVLVLKMFSWFLSFLHYLACVVNWPSDPWLCRSWYTTQAADSVWRMRLAFLWPKFLRTMTKSFDERWKCFSFFKIFSSFVSFKIFLTPGSERCYYLVPKCSTSENSCNAFELERFLFRRWTWFGPSHFAGVVEEPSLDGGSSHQVAEPAATVAGPGN